MAASILYLGSVGSGMATLAKTRAERRFAWLETKYFKRKTIVVFFDKSKAMLLPEAAEDEATESSLSGLLSKLSEAAQRRRPLVVENIDLFFKSDLSLCRWFMDKASEKGVDIFASASRLSMEVVELFEQIKFGHTEEVDAPFLARRSRLESGQCINVNLTKPSYNL